MCSVADQTTVPIGMYSITFWFDFRIDPSHSYVAILSDFKKQRISVHVTRRLTFVGHCKSHSLWGIWILETRHFQLTQFATNAAIVQQGLWPTINHVLVSPHQDAPGHVTETEIRLALLVHPTLLRMNSLCVRQARAIPASLSTP